MLLVRYATKTSPGKVYEEVRFVGIDADELITQENDFAFNGDDLRVGTAFVVPDENEMIMIDVDHKDHVYLKEFDGEFSYHCSIDQLNRLARIFTRAVEVADHAQSVRLAMDSDNYLIPNDKIPCRTRYVSFDDGSCDNQPGTVDPAR